MHHHTHFTKFQQLIFTAVKIKTVFTLRHYRLSAFLTPSFNRFHEHKTGKPLALLRCLVVTWQHVTLQTLIIIISQSQLVFSQRKSRSSRCDLILVRLFFIFNFYEIPSFGQVALNRTKIFMCSRNTLSILISPCSVNHKISNRFWKNLLNDTCWRVPQRFSPIKVKAENHPQQNRELLQKSI